MILTAEQLRQLVPGAFCPDQNYAVPTSAWLLKEFYPWFWQMRTALGLRVYSRRNDCDNYARAAAQAAEDCHSLTAGGPDAEGLAVGEFWYRKDSGEGHAICVAIVDDGRRIFFEPQSGDELKLTSKEFASCYFARF